MTDENKNVEEIKVENKCFCKSEEFKKFIVVATGSFVGVFFALCLFSALHRPPIPHMMPLSLVPVHQQINNFDRTPIPPHLQGKPRHHEFDKPHRPHKHFAPKDDRRIEHNGSERIHPQPIE